MAFCSLVGERLTAAYSFFWVEVSKEDAVIAAGKGRKKSHKNKPFGPRPSQWNSVTLNTVIINHFYLIIGDSIPAYSELQIHQDCRSVGLESIFVIAGISACGKAYINPKSGMLRA